MKKFTALSLALALGAVGTSQIAQAQNNGAKSKGPLSRPATFVGIVSGQPQNGEIYLRANGQNWRIKAASKEMLSKVQGGERVRAFGRPLGNVVYNAQIRVLRPKASDSADDYLPRR